MLHVNLKLQSTKHGVCVIACVYLYSETMAQAEGQDHLQISALKGTAGSQRFKQS